MSGKILVVDDQASNRFLLKAILEKDFYTVSEAINGLDCLVQIYDNPPDLIILDVEMPDLDGLEACTIIKANPATHHIPVIMITAGDTQAERNLGLKAGADDFLHKPFDTRILYARVRNLMRVKSLITELQLRNLAATGAGISSIDELSISLVINTRVLLVTRTVETANYFMEHLHKSGQFKVDILHTEVDVIERLSTQDYDAIVVFELLKNDGLGLRLIAQIRSEWRHRNRVIMFVSNADPEIALRSLDLGASDYVVLPLDPIELQVRLQTQLKRMHYADQLRSYAEDQMRYSVIDPLTDLHNRRYFNLYLPKILQRSQETGQKFAVMMLDLDKFKSLNDQYGHDFGDIVLVETARRLKQSLRAADLIVRFGGEEFVVIAPNVTLTLAQEISERLRASIETAPFITTKGEYVSVTTSIGVTIGGGDDVNISELLKSSDDALYIAKSQGRNQVIFSAA